MGLTLVVLAAGVGSRYGGPKQIDRVGPGGSTLIDYAVYDARRAGFERAVLVVREGTEAEMRGTVGDRIARHVQLDYATQPSALPGGRPTPPGRVKPWGTGHATLAAAGLVDGPFAVVNADDFYGAASYGVLAEHLRGAPGALPPGHALVGFPLATTLSPDGPVSRGVLTVAPDGRLAGVRELLKIERDGDDARYLEDDGSWRALPGATPVSLNFWGFQPDLLDELARGFERFLRESSASATAEFYLPAAVQELIAAHKARVRVLGGGGPWAGLTYPGDRPRLVELLRALTARGVYPEDLWP